MIAGAPAAGRRRPARSRPRARQLPGTNEDGSLAMPLLVVVWVAFGLTVALIDIGAYLVAASRAQGSADAAALAAIAADLAAPAPATIVARSVAGRDGARVEACDCRAGAARVEVTVSVPVGGLFIARIGGAQRVTATAEAQLVEDPGSPVPHRGGSGHDELPGAGSAGRTGPGAPAAPGGGARSLGSDGAAATGAPAGGERDGWATPSGPVGSPRERSAAAWP